MVAADYGMCGLLRVCWPADVLKAHGCNNIFCSRTYMSSLPTQAVLVQRSLDKAFNASLKKEPSLKIADFDDMLFPLYGEYLPSYNNVKYRNDEKACKEAMEDLCTFIDKITVSTEYLKQAILDNYNFDKVEVVPNYLPRFIFHYNRKPHKTEDIKKPRIVYAGGGQHYNNTLKQTGDFSPSFVQFLHNIVDKCELIFVGELPFFMEDVKDKIQVHPWVNTLNYANFLYSLNADFILAPLKENVFNKCKSNLKYLESCAVGSVCFASDFEFSPYSMVDNDAKFTWTMNAKQLEYNFWNLCNKDVYNRILDKQYDYINEMWLENNINLHYKLFIDKEVNI